MNRLTSLLLLCSTLNLSAQVSPQLKTSWGQGCYYNAELPTDGAGPCDRVLTGCNATALAQVIRFHEHPATGFGEQTHHSEYGELTSDYSSRSYDFNNMPDRLSSSDDPTPIAELMRDLGVGVSMMYGAGVSNSSFNSGISLLKEHFRYSLHTTRVYVNEYTPSDLTAMLIAELDAGRVIMADGGSHFYVIDGYELEPTVKFHCNFGWNGTYNDYFPIDAVIPPNGKDYSPFRMELGIEPLAELEVAYDVQTVSPKTTTQYFSIAAIKDWSLTVNQPWLSVEKTTGTDGYYRLAMDLETNDTYAERTATVTVSDGVTIREIVVTQSGVIPQLTIQNDHLFYGFDGGMQSVEIASDSSWNYSTGSDWLTLSSDSDSQLMAVTDENTSLSDRVGIIRLQRGKIVRSIVVEQLGAGTEICTPEVISSPPDGTGILQVSMAGLVFNSDASEAFVCRSSTIQLYRDSTYTLSADFSEFVAGGAWIDWNQNNFMGDENEALLGTYDWYQATGIKDVTFTVPHDAKFGTTVMRIIGQQFFDGPAQVPCTETGPITGEVEQYIIEIVDPSVARLNIDPSSILQNSRVGSQPIAVDADSSWQIVEFPSWTTFSSSEGTGADSILIDFDENESTSPRNGLITLERGNLIRLVRVEQLGTDTTLSFVDHELDIASIGGPIVATIHTNVSYEVSSSDDWIQTNDESASSTILTFNVSTNESLFERTGHITLTSGSHVDSLVIQQAASSADLMLSRDTIFVSNERLTDEFEVMTDGNWSATSSESWLRLDQIDGIGNRTVNVTAEPYFGAEKRSAIVTVTNGVNTATLIVEDPRDEVTFLENAQLDNWFSLSQKDREISVITPVKQDLYIYSSEGRLVMTLPVRIGHNAVSLNHLENGMYFVRHQHGVNSVLLTK